MRSYFYVMSLEKPLRPGVTANGTVTGTVTPAEGATRQDVYQDIYTRATNNHLELAGATVLFFSLEPNQL